MICKWLKEQKAPPQAATPREDRNGIPITTPLPAPEVPKKSNLPDFSNVKDKNFYPLAEYQADPDYGGNLVKREFVIFHHTCSYNLKNTASYFKSEGVDIHFLVGHDGAVIQMVPLNKAAAHAGNSSWGGYSGLNNYSIGVEVINIGPLTKKGEKFFDCYNREWKGGVRKRKGQGYEFWEPFTDAQEKACMEIAWYCHKVLGISVDKMLAHYEVSPGRKNDPYGGFSYGDMEETRKYWKTVFV